MMKLRPYGIVHTVGVSSQGVTPSYRTINWLDRHIPDPEDQRAFAKERCVLAVTEALHNAMEHSGINQAEVAERLGKSRGYVSRVLNGAHNMTLYTLGDILWACTMELRDLEVAPLGEITVSSDDAIEWEQIVPTHGPSPPPTLPLAAAHSFPTLISSANFLHA